MKTRAKRLRQGLADAKQGFADGKMFAKMILVNLKMPVEMKKQVEAIAGEKGESFSAFVRFAIRDRLQGKPAFKGSAEEIQQTAALVQRFIHLEARKMARGQKMRKGKQLQNE